MGGIGSGNCLKERKEAGVSGGILQYQAWAWLGMLRTVWVLVPGEGAALVQSGRRQGVEYWCQGIWGKVGRGLGSVYKDPSCGSTENR